MKLNRSNILRNAWPIILANSSSPLLGIMDTAVIGRNGRLEDLGAIALGSLIFNFIYWSFGFLRMGTTGFVALADGRGDEIELRAAIFRALLSGLALGLILIFLQLPLIEISLHLLGGGPEVERTTAEYFDIRIWAAPASLGLFSLMGSFIGLGKSGQLLRMQILLNGLNAIFDIFFAGVMKMGARGVALGTFLSAWITFFVSIYVLFVVLKERKVLVENSFLWNRIFNMAALKEMSKANADIMIRTLLLIAGFSWFTDQSARYGNTVLAANHILLQFISLSAFFLDGFAFTAESLVGRAAGSGNRLYFDTAVRLTTEFSAISSVLLALVFIVAGEIAISILTDLPGVIYTARILMPWTILYILLSFAAFQLDGIFIGTMRTRDMRNASVISLGAFLLASLFLQIVTDAGVKGLWLSFVFFVTIRAMTLLVRYRSVRRTLFKN